MNKSKYLIAVGTFLLAVGSFFAGNAAKKLFTTYTSLYWKVGVNGTCRQFTSQGVFTSSGSNISFVTTGGSPATIHTTSNCSTTAVTVSLID